MSKRSTYTIFGALASLIASLTLIQPAASVEVDNFGIFPYQLKVGQTAVIGIELVDCVEAPTTLSVAVTNGNDEVTLTNANANFKSKLVNDTYSASWTYSGANGKGVKAGQIFVAGEVSGGCAGNVIGELDAYGFVQNSKASNVRGYIRNVEINPGLDGLLVNWSEALGATEYQVRIAESGTDNWVNAGATAENSLFIPSDEFNLEYSVQYVAAVKPIYGQSAGEWINSNLWRGYVSKAEAWTSLVGDSQKNPVFDFDSAAEVQFNLKVENCADTSGLANPYQFVNDLWSGTMDGGNSSTEYSYNEQGDSSYFSNYEVSVQGETVIVSWQLTQDLDADTYKWGTYFVGGSGCVHEGWDNIFSWPYSEYNQFSVSENGKIIPVVDGIDSIVKATSKDLRISWNSPVNSDDGPFTYQIYNTNYSESESDWDLIKTTNKRSIRIKNLQPENYQFFAVKVTNSIGTNQFFIDAETLGYYAKPNSSMSLADLIKPFNYSKKLKKTFKLTSTSFFASPNVCTVKKNNIKFRKKQGVCAVKLTGGVNGDPFVQTFEIWSMK